MQDEAKRDTNEERAGAASGPASATQVLVFSFSGCRVDPAAVGARLAQWVGADGSVTCWTGDEMPPAAVTSGASAAVSGRCASVVLASHRDTVHAAARRQLAGTSVPWIHLPASDARRLRDCLGGEDDGAILLLDEALVRGLDADTAQWLAALTRRRRAVLVCDHAGTCRADCALVRGMHGCLAVDAAAGVWARAIAAVARGELWLPRAVLQQAADAARRASLPEIPVESLTPREAQAVSLVREGLANKEIARRLGIGEDTVKKHLQHAFAKLGVHRRALVALGKVGPAHA